MVFHSQGHLTKKTLVCFYLKILEFCYYSRNCESSIVVLYINMSTCHKILRSLMTSVSLNYRITRGSLFLQIVLLPLWTYIIVHCLINCGWTIVCQRTPVSFRFIADDIILVWIKNNWVLSEKCITDKFLLWQYTTRNETITSDNDVYNLYFKLLCCRNFSLNCVCSHR